MAFQYVTLVAQGGTPVRLANALGAPYPTTGTGSLVFSNGAVLTNPTINGYTPELPLALPNGSLSSPPIYWGTSDRGIYSTGSTNLRLVAQGTVLADFTAGNLTMVGNVAAVNVNASGGLTVGSTASVTGALTLGVDLTVPNGGTGASTFTQNGVMYGNAASALGVTAAGTTGQVLVATTGSAPSWAALSGLGVTSWSAGTTGFTPSAATTGVVTLAGTLVVGNGGTGAATLAANGVIYGNGTSAVGVTAVGATGQVLIGNTAAAPSWGTLSSVAVTTLSFGTTGLTPNSATSGAITVAGTLLPANGGTGITSLGTGVATALGTNVGAAGAFVVFNGALGTPSSGTLTNATGLPISTGISGLGTGVATFLGTPSSANLRAALTDETGTGAVVFAGSPALTGTPTFAGATSGTIGLVATAIAGSNTLTLPAVTGTLLTNVSVGTPIQFVSTNWTSTTTTTSSTYAAISAAATSITPRSNTNKVRVQMALSVGCNSVTGALFRVKRAGTVIGADPFITVFTGGAGTSTIVPVVIDFLDSPASTSSLSYTLEWRNTDNVNGLAFNQNVAASLTGSSTVTLTEIVA